MADVSWQIFHRQPLGFDINAIVHMTGHERQLLKDNYHWNGLQRGSEGVLIWQYTISGCGLLRCGNEYYKIHPGSAMLVLLPQDHEYKVDPDTGYWEFEFITMFGSECVRIGKEIQISHGPLLIHEENSESLQCAKKIMQETESDTCRLSILAYEFIMLLGKEFHGGGLRRFDNSSCGLLAAHNLALKKFADQLSVQEMADVAGLSYAHFIREFTKMFNISPGALLNNLQMEMAAALINRSQLPLKEVAERCGFSSVQYFCRVFKRHFKVTPQTMRKNKKNTS